MVEEVKLGAVKAQKAARCAHPEYSVGGLAKALTDSSGTYPAEAPQGKDHIQFLAPAICCARIEVNCCACEHAAAPM